MALLDDIVDLKISVQQAALLPNDFSTILVLVYDADNEDRSAKSFSDYTSISKAEEFKDNEIVLGIAKVIFTQNVPPKRLLLKRTQVLKNGFLEALQNESFYGVLNAGGDIDQIVDLVPAVDTSNKLYGIDTQAVPNSSDDNGKDILSKLRTDNATSNRVFCTHHSSNKCYQTAAWMSKMLTEFLPGEASWSYKEVNSVSNNVITTDQINVLNTKRGNYYTPFGNTNVMMTGVATNATSLRYLDITQGLDFVDSTIKTKIANALVLNKKIGYTNQGIAIIRSCIEAALKEAGNMGIVDANTIVINVPDVTEISTADKQNRILSNVTFSATLVGAIHKVQINGTVNY